MGDGGAGGGGGRQQCSAFVVDVEGVLGGAGDGVPADCVLAGGGHIADGHGGSGQVAGTALCLGEGGGSCADIAERLDLVGVSNAGLGGVVGDGGASGGGGRQQCSAFVVDVEGVLGGTADSIPADCVLTGGSHIADGHGGPCQVAGTALCLREGGGSLADIAECFDLIDIGDAHLRTVVVHRSVGGGGCPQQCAALVVGVEGVLGGAGDGVPADCDLAGGLHIGCGQSGLRQIADAGDDVASFRDRAGVRHRLHIVVIGLACGDGGVGHLCVGRGGQQGIGAVLTGGPVNFVLCRTTDGIPAEPDLAGGGYIGDADSGGLDLRRCLLREEELSAFSAAVVQLSILDYFCDFIMPGGSMELSVVIVV